MLSLGAKRSGVRVPLLLKSQCTLIAVRSNNLVQYVSDWPKTSASNTTVSASNRPLPVAVFNGNVTVQGSWVNPSNMTAASQIYNRTLTNISMAMPHSGVVAAATLMENNLF